MIKLRNKYNFLWLSILVAAFVALMQVLSNEVGLIIALGLFILLAVIASAYNMTVPILAFFLPWAPLIKIRPGTISMYTVVLLAALLILFLRNIKHFPVLHFFPAVLLFALTVSVKTVTNEPIDKGFIIFFCCLMLFPLVASEKEKKYDFYALVLFFALGIITSALSAKQLMVFPTISRYIVIHSYQSITRLSGYYGDPNFYSAHITAAIAGMLVLMFNERKASRRILLYVLLAVLLYCGFLSVSKTFALIMICIILFWILEVMFRRGKVSSKIMLILALLVGCAFVLSSVLFTDLIDMIVSRFIDSGSSLSDLTTGRTDIWNSYFREFEEYPAVLIFGKGFTDELVNDSASHNIIVQSIYQFGLIGTTLLLAWGWAYAKNVLNRISISSKNIVQSLILVMGAFGPWMSIDPLKFDELFIMPFIVFMGIIYIEKGSVTAEELSDNIGELNETE